MVISGGLVVVWPQGECARGTGSRNTLHECGLTCRVVTATADHLSSDLQMSDRQTDRLRDTERYKSTDRQVY